MNKIRLILNSISDLNLLAKIRPLELQIEVNLTNYVIEIFREQRWKLNKLQFSLKTRLNKAFMLQRSSRWPSLTIA